MSEPDITLSPPDRRWIWKNLALTMSQAAALTGVSERQIQHWMDRGYLTPSSRGTRKLNGDSIDKILLIRQARAAGLPLRRAVALAQGYLGQEASPPLDPDVAPDILQDLQERVRALRADLETVEDLMQNIASGNGSVRP